MPRDVQYLSGSLLTDLWTTRDYRPTGAVQQSLCPGVARFCQGLDLPVVWDAMSAILAKRVNGFQIRLSHASCDATYSISRCPGSGEASSHTVTSL